MSAGEPLITHAFGLALEAAFPIDGCPPITPSEEAVPARPRVRIELAERGELADAFAEGGTVIARRPRPDGAPGMIDDIVHHPSAGYLLDEGEVGRFAIDCHADRVRCAPGPVDRWRWQRHLIGRALPFTAGLRGFEPWHASAVATESGVIVLAGDAGRGKSTLAVELLLAGGRLLADDVLTLELRGNAVVGHPGAGAMSLRSATVARLTATELARLGTEIGGDVNGIRIVTAREPAALPLAAVILLDRGDPVPEPITRLDPRALLGSTFDFVTGGADRLVRQLDVCAAIARRLPVMRLGSGPGRDSRAAAASLLAALAELHPGGAHRPGGAQ